MRVKAALKPTRVRFDEGRAGRCCLLVVKSHKRRVTRGRSRPEHNSEDHGSPGALYVCERQTTRLGRHRAEAARLLQLAEQDVQVNTHEPGQEYGSMVDEVEMQQGNVMDIIPGRELTQVPPMDHAPVLQSVDRLDKGFGSASDIERDSNVDHAAAEIAYVLGL